MTRAEALEHVQALRGAYQADLDEWRGRYGGRPAVRETIDALDIVLAMARVYGDEHTDTK
jgi:hypothetical protein